MARAYARAHDGAMQVLRAGATSRPRLALVPLLAAFLIGVVLVGAGVAAAWVAMTGTLLNDASLLGRGPVVRPVVGGLAFALAFLIPAVLVVAGLARVVRAIDGATGRRMRRGPVATLSRRLPNDYAVVAAVRTPEKRLIPEIVVGPTGIVVVEPLPPVRASRVHGRSWEVRLSNGRWLPIENPLDRASRDAERLRGWLSSEWESWAPRVYAAVVADGHEVSRLPDVAVVTREELGAFLTSMPVSKSMTPDRRRDVIELLSAG